MLYCTTVLRNQPLRNRVIGYREIEYEIVPDVLELPVYIPSEDEIKTRELTRMFVL